MINHEVNGHDKLQSNLNQCLMCSSEDRLDG